MHEVGEAEAFPLSLDAARADVVTPQVPVVRVAAPVQRLGRRWRPIALDQAGAIVREPSPSANVTHVLRVRSEPSACGEAVVREKVSGT